MTRSTTFTIPATTYNPNKSPIRIRFNRPPPPPCRITIPRFVFSFGWVQPGLRSAIKKIEKSVISKREIAPRQRLHPSYFSFSRVGSSLNAASSISSPPLFPVCSDESPSSLSSLSTLSLGSSPPPYSPALSVAEVSAFLTLGGFGVWRAEGVTEVFSRGCKHLSFIGVGSGVFAKYYLTLSFSVVVVSPFRLFQLGRGSHHQDGSSSCVDADELGDIGMNSGLG